MTESRFLQAALVVGAVVIASPARAQAPAGQGDVKKMCSDAYVAAQRSRKAGELTEARKQMLVCARDACPAALRSGCTRWLGEVNDEIPTVVFGATGPDGADLAAVKVYVDGQKVADSLDGRPIALDPGAHTVRFTREGGAEMRQELVLKTGAKNRAVSVRFPAPKGTGPRQPEPQPAPAAPDAPRSSGQAVAGYVLGGVGLVGIGLFAGLGLHGLGQVDDLDATCGVTGTCDPDEVDGIATRFVVADVSLAVGAVALGVGVGLVIDHHLSSDDEGDAAATAPRLRVRAGADGVRGGLAWSF